MKHFTRFYPWLVLLLALVLAGCAGGGGAAGEVDSIEEGDGLGREGMVLITEENVSEGVEMQIGQQAVVMLDDGYDWAVNATPDMVFSKMKGATLQEGEQGIFEAKFAGSATLQAIGKPVCLQADPPCTDPQKQYLIKVRVRPASN